jgi:xanthine dehydrogenase accessory factor
MHDWAGEALAIVAAGAPAALVTLLAVEGSAPREAGARILVWADGQSGSIGGGNLEHIAADQARRMLALDGGPAWAAQDYPLGPLLAQCCGGRVRLLIERLGPDDAGWLSEAHRLLEAGLPLERRLALDVSGLDRSVRRLTTATWESAAFINDRPAAARGPKPNPGDLICERIIAHRSNLALFGAGHVGQALARALEPLPLRVSWFDTRPETRQIGGVCLLSASEAVAAAREPRDHVLIMTHDHALDYALVAAALTGPAPHVGLIGSKTKRARFLSRLRADGLGEAAAARLVCPIGLAQIRSKAPEAIAVSVAADLLIRLEAARLARPTEASVAGL